MNICLFDYKYKSILCGCSIIFVWTYFQEIVDKNEPEDESSEEEEDDDENEEGVGRSNWLCYLYLS